MDVGVGTVAVLCLIALGASLWALRGSRRLLDEAERIATVTVSPESTFVRPIHNEADYRTVLGLVENLMKSDPEPGTPDGWLLDVLAELVWAYEQRTVVPDFAPEPSVPPIQYRSCPDPILPGNWMVTKTIDGPEGTTVTVPIFSGTEAQARDVLETAEARQAEDVHRHHVAHRIVAEGVDFWTVEKQTVRTVGETMNVYRDRAVALACAQGLNAKTGPTAI